MFCVIELMSLVLIFFQEFDSFMLILLGWLIFGSIVLSLHHIVSLRLSGILKELGFFSLILIFEIVVNRKSAQKTCSLQFSYPAYDFANHSIPQY